MTILSTYKNPPLLAKFSLSTILFGKSPNHNETHWEEFLNDSDGQLKK